MTVFETINQWAKLLPPKSESIPSRLKVSQYVYSKLVEEATLQLIKPYEGESKFGPVPVDIDPELETGWIMYDQYGKEMKRSE